ncbi:HlyD family secretion protein [Enterobacteriaceae bacterium H20N1]|uniref:HlyD family secretion protein n=1 Tax=Dryocola boscaweniae TaxID=2925397 RepID=A0A9X3ABJ3_9ENTR|nr:HlyD family secretion protein [Dryocola boscaweniae]MCT4702544.1 HlyD family secretion protein [Dryocola boscaweniae]MCT4719712.1 HlyD family secretion protein [Dryocola boscaweniae]
MRSGFPAWLLAIITFTFFALLVAFLIFGSWHRRVVVSGELVSAPRAVTLYSSWQGIIERSFVLPGEVVKKGTPLYEINIDRTIATGAFSTIQKENIQKRIAALDSIILRVKQNKAIALATLRKQKASYESALEHSQKILASARAGLKNTRQNMESYQSHLRRGLITKDQLTNQVSLHHQQQINLLNISTQHEQNTLQNMLLTSTLQTQATDFDNQLFELEIQRGELLSQRASAEADGTVVVTSPVEGKIETTGVIVGQTIRNGDCLAQIIPGNVSHYTLVLWVPAYAVPYIAPGDTVNVRYAAFPAEKFGQFFSTIQSISELPVPVQEMATWPSAKEKMADPSETWFKLIVKPQNTLFHYRDKTFLPQNGMRASGVLFLEKRSLIEWVLSPLSRIKNDTSGPVDGK